MDFGLEVSQALLPDDGQEESFIEKYLGCRKEELPPLAFEKYGERLNFYNGRFWAILPDNTVQQDYLSKAKYRFDRKLEKLNAKVIFLMRSDYSLDIRRKMSLVLLKTGDKIRCISDTGRYIPIWKNAGRYLPDTIRQGKK